MNDFRLTFSKSEWDSLSGEQKTAIAFLRRIVRDLDNKYSAAAELNQTPAEMISDIADWLSFDGPLGPRFCEELLELDEGVIVAHMTRKVEEAKARV